MAKREDHDTEAELEATRPAAADQQPTPSDPAESPYDRQREGSPKKTA